MAAAADHPALRRDYPALSDALWQAASPQIRNMATLGGNVLQRTRCNYFRDPSWPACNKRAPGSGCAALGGSNRLLAVLGVSDHCIAHYPGDFAVPLVALGATATLLATDGATRTIPFDELHRLPGDTPHIETTLRPGGLITGVHVPAGPWTRRSLYRKMRERESYAFALAAAGEALAAAPVTVDARYSTPTQHHNPIELYTTTCGWNGDELTIWEPSQFVYGLRGNVAKQLGIDSDKVRVVSKFVGGAFGSKGGATARTAWIAIAARRLGRPVGDDRVALGARGGQLDRAETRHHVQRGAGRDGRLLSLRHEGWEVTSRPSTYNVSGTESTARLYRCPNILTRVNIVHADRSTPGFMRAPPDVPYMFALESAMDELAAKLGLTRWSCAGATSRSGTR